MEKKLKILDKIITAAFPDINKEELFSVFTKESSIKYAGSNNSASDCHSTYSEVSYISITENNDPPITDEKSLQKEFLSELNVAVRNRASEINADTDRLIKDSSEEKSIEDNDEVEYATVNTNGMKYENFHSTDEMISNIDNIMSWLNAINQPGCEEDKRVIINLLSEDIIDIKSSLKEIDENLRNIPQDSIYEIKSELLEILEDNTEQFMRKYESSLGTYPDIKVAYENIGQILLSAEDVLIGSNKAGNSRKIINDRSYSFARYKTEKRESEKLNN
ncbi:hypothetical protein EB241_06900 [Erwinia psidii]|uniref:Uncharacterized protein n=1 Tax=Erwinia psidii TaxID=69224 RepID=A0A3N6S098_9GAMM|nr:hypothetical protein EB241_06900 [Erwinia psidii]